MSLGRFEAAAALQHSATHFSLKGTQQAEALAHLLRLEAEELVKLGLQEVKIAYADPTQE